MFEILRTSFPRADHARPRRKVRDFLIEALCVIGFATVMTITEPSGTRWNIYYLPVILAIFLVPTRLVGQYRSKKALTLGYVFGNELLTWLLLMFSFVLFELFMDKLPNGFDLCVASSILFLVVTLEFFIMLVLLQRIASPKCQLNNSAES